MWLDGVGMRHLGRGYLVMRRGEGCGGGTWGWSICGIGMVGEAKRYGWWEEDLEGGGGI